MGVVCLGAVATAVILPFSGAADSGRAARKENQVQHSAVNSMWKAQADQQKRSSA